MSLTKNSQNFEDLNPVNEMVDMDYQFQEWQNLEEEAEKATFMRIFENTNTYPF